MHRLFSMFPSGLPGAGLLVLRGGIALMLWASPPTITGYLGLTPSLCCATALSILILVGALTPLTSLLCTAFECVPLFTLSHGGWSDDRVALLAAPLALMLLGPGAYSLDCRFFGHHTIHLDHPTEGYRDSDE